MEVRNLVGAWFQALAFAVSVSCVTAFYMYRYNLFFPKDPIPVLTQSRGVKHSVHAGLHIKNFSVFNVVKGNFEVEGIVWFSFDPSIIPLDQIKKFSISHGDLLRISDPIISQMHDNTVAQFDVHFNFETHLNYRMFPIDDHFISFEIINHYLPLGVEFVSSKENVTFENDMYIPGWILQDYLVQVGLISTQLSAINSDYRIEHPAVAITLSCQRANPSTLINFLLTLIIILFTSLFTFSSREDTVLIVSVTIVALIGYSVVIQNVSPDQVSYFILSDYLYLTTLVCVILTLLLGIFARDKKFSIQDKKRAIIGIYTLFVCGTTLLSLLL